MDIFRHRLNSYEIDFVKDNVIRLNLNEGDVDTKNYYNLNEDVYDSCYSAISKYNKVSKNNILVTNGSSEAIRSILQCISFNKTQPVYGIIISPTYEFTIKMMKWFNIIVKDTKVTTLQKDIEEYKKKGIIIVYIDSPNNPTGYTWLYKDIESIVRINSEVVFIIDEAYIEFSDEQSSSILVLKYNNIIITKTFSKAFSMADYRIGYLISNPINIKYIKSFINPLSVTRESMEVATKKLTNELPIYLERISSILKVKEEFKSKCKDLNIVQDVISGGGNFVIIRFKIEYDSKDIYNKLLENNIVVRYKSTFQNGIRVSITDIEDMNYVMRKLIDINVYEF